MTSPVPASHMPHPSPSGGIMPSSPLNPSPMAHSPGPNMQYMPHADNNSPFGALVSFPSPFIVSTHQPICIEINYSHQLQHLIGQDRQACQDRHRDQARVPTTNLNRNVRERNTPNFVRSSFDFAFSQLSPRTFRECCQPDRGPERFQRC